MVFGEITVYAAGSGAHIKRVPKTDAADVASAARELPQRRQGTSAPTAQPAPAADPVDQLRKLAGLRDAGIITTEGLEAKKVQLMALI